MGELLTVFLAGLVSFLSPCVLPLVPGYISMLSGVGVEQLRQGQTPRNNLMASALAFVVGLSVVFVAFGASASAIGHFLSHNKSQLAPIAGAIVILFGLHLIGVLARISWIVGGVLTAVLLALALTVYLRPGMLGESWRPVEFISLALVPALGPGLTRWLNRDVHFRNVGGTKPGEQKQPGSFSGIVSGFLMGFAFAFGWTPCIGPILGGVLALAATSANISRGIFLLAIYSAGLSIPFLLTALGVSQFLRFYQKFRRYLHAVEIASGVLLLFIGILMFNNRLTWLSGKLTFLNRFIR
jgi:cytochrome c-type biogenesis protein